MLNSSDFKDEIIANFNSGDYDNDPHGAWADGITDYITDNLELEGVYTGTIGVAPDPLSGLYTWGVSTLEVNSTVLSNSASGTEAKVCFTNWVQVGIFASIISSFSIVGFDNSNLVSTLGIPLGTLPLVLTLSLSDIQGSTDFEGIIETICDKIITDFKTAIIAPSTGNSTSGGNGTIIFSLIK